MGKTLCDTVVGDYCHKYAQSRKLLRGYSGLARKDIPYPWEDNNARSQRASGWLRSLAKKTCSLEKSFSVGLLAGVGDAPVNYEKSSGTSRFYKMKQVISRF